MRLARMWPYALLLALVVIARAPSLLLPVWNVDEGFTSVTANVIRAGGVPYRDAVDHRAPLTNYVYALVFSLFGRNDMRALHAVLILWIAATAFVIFALGRRIGGRRCGLLA